MSAPAFPPPTSADPLPGYVGLPGRYDECRAADGSIRPHWAEFLRLIGGEATAKLRGAAEACARAILEQDVSLNVYAGARSEPQPWPLDAVPHLISAEDWAVLSAGLRQRAQLYNELLADLYGTQKLFRNGSLPPELAMINPHFLRPCGGLGKRGGVFLHNCAMDIARSPDGQWWVLQDRLDAPSGLGYSLQNRTILRRALSGAYHGAQVQSLRDFSRSFHASLLELAGSSAPGSEDARVVLLTPGVANETYFEHAYLARHFGYPLVEGADLTTRDRQVFLRTVGGLKRVSAILRRVDSSFCDPLELNPRSLLGVPGLVHAAHAGKVAISNQLGAGAFESTALLSFLKPLCREVLGEDLRLPSVATWWCGQEKARRYVLERLSSLVVKPTFRVTSGTRYGALLTPSQRDALAAEITARPWAHCGQERVFLGTTPAFSEGEVRPVPFVMRLFVCWQDGEYRVMPGGLTRFNPTGEDAIISLQQGSATKDTWVLGANSCEVAAPSEMATDDLHRSLATPSRVADNLYWMGRYLERLAQLSRLLEKLDPLLRDEVAALDPAVAADALNILLAAQGSYAPPGATPEELAARIRTLADDPEQPGSLARNLGHLIRNLDQVKVRLPPEAWRILRRLRAIAATPHPQLAGDLGEQLSSLETLATETLAHDTGWRFLKLGRRIERAYQLIFLARELLVPDEEGTKEPKDSRPSANRGPREFRLQTLLHFTDSLFAYRGIYHSIFQPAPVLAWMLGAPENPRGFRFQADRIAEHLAAIPDELAPRAVASLRAASFRLVSHARLLDAPALASNPALLAKYFTEASETLSDLNTRLTQVYFSHTEIPGSRGPF